MHIGIEANRAGRARRKLQHAKRHRNDRKERRRARVDRPIGADDEVDSDAERR